MSTGLVERPTTAAGLGHLTMADSSKSKGRRPSIWGLKVFDEAKLIRRKPIS
jgi:hypothetical protein